MGERSLLTLMLLNTKNESDSILIMYTKLKALYTEVKDHTDLTRRSIPFFVKAVQEIRVELQKLSNAQAEQISRDVSDAMRLIAISEREDLNNIENYMKEVPKYLGRMRDSILKNLEFVNRVEKRSGR
jgi:hypothetical protein